VSSGSLTDIDAGGFKTRAIFFRSTCGIVPDNEREDGSVGRAIVASRPRLANHFLAAPQVLN